MDPDERLGCRAGTGEPLTRPTSFVWTDAVVSLVSLAAFVAVSTPRQHSTSTAEPVLTVLLLWSALMLVLLTTNSSISPWRGVRQCVRDIAKAAAVVLIGILVAEALVGSAVRDRVPPVIVLPALFFCAGCMVIARVGQQRLRSPADEVTERVVIVGTGVVADDITGRLERSSKALMVGLVDDEPVDGWSVIASLDDLPALCRTERVTRVIVAFTRSEPSRLMPILRSLPETVKVDLVPRYFELTGRGSRIEDFSGLSLVTLPPRCAPGTRDVIKRAFDVVVAGVILVLCAPVLLISAAALWVAREGPVLFRQERLGRGREPFRIAKFRTLRDLDDRSESGEDASTPTLHSELVASRVTTVGKVLRRTSIDELPQLFNVLAGHMSIVGPRPLIPDECHVLTGEAQHRFDVRPGLTGLWQVSGQHSLRPEELVRLDAHYVQTWTFWNDIRILAMTPSRLVRGGGDGAAKAIVLTAEVDAA
jgi:exopolysaccharide biosynthesis polyprenyl glycosylphosphotransferase